MIYLVGPLWDYNNVVQLALHRVQSCSPLEARVHWPETFDLDNYISSQQGFNYPTGEGRINLVIHMNSDAALHLAERPLSRDQAIRPVDKNRVQVSATVLDTDALVWWLLGFGPSVEVLEPLELRERIHAALASATGQYSERQTAGYAGSR